MDTRRRLPDPVFLALAAAGVGLVLVSPALLSGEGLLPVGSLWRVPPWNRSLQPTPGNGLLIDQLLQFWPWRLYWRSEMLAGRFPFWNPLIASGVPFAANPQTASFYPLTFLLLVLPPASWSVAAAFLKIFFAGFFTALHVLRLGGGRRGAAQAGVVFALSGFMIAWLGHPHTDAACLLPALFWAVGRAFDLFTPRAWVPAAVATGVILVAGHPPTILHVLSAAAAYVVYRILVMRSDRRRTGLTAALLAGAAGAALAAPAILLYLEYLSWSSTGAASERLSRWATHLPAAAALQLLMPLSAGSPTHGAEVLQSIFGLGPAANFLERAGWVGLPAAVLAALAIIRRGKESAVRFYAVLTAFGLAAAFGVAPLPRVWSILPVYSAANPVRLLLLFCFGMAVLSGLGAADERPAPKKLSLWFCVLAAAAAVCFAAAVYFARQSLTGGEIGFTLGQACAFAAEAAAAWILLRPSARRWAPVVSALFLLRIGLGINPTAPSSLIFPPTPETEALANAQGEGRVFGLGAAVAPDCGMPLGLRDARGRDFTSLRRYEELATGRAGDFDFFESAMAPPPNPELLGISVLAATEKTIAGVPPDWMPAAGVDLSLFRPPRPGRRALFVPRAVTALPAQSLAAVRSPSFDPKQVVVLDDWFSASAAAGALGDAHIVAETSGRVEIAAHADGPGWLLFLDSWYPGWRAEVDGVPVAVRRADYAFRAVPVSAGNSHVVFTYTPFAFWIGLFLSGVAAAGLGWAWRRT